MIDKTIRSVAEAMAGIKDGSTVLIAGFAQVGEPRALIDGLIEQGARDLTVVHNTAGRGREGVARLIGEGRVRKIVCSFARSRGSVIFEEVFARGAIELEIVPQGTMAERMRAAAHDCFPRRHRRAHSPENIDRKRPARLRCTNFVSICPT